MISIEIKDNMKTSKLTIHMVRNKETRMENILEIKYKDILIH